MACEILVPLLRIKPVSPAMKVFILIAGPPGKTLASSTAAKKSDGTLLLRIDPCVYCL